MKGARARAGRGTFRPALSRIEPLPFTSQVWHQGAPTRGFLDTAAVAKGQGRYHRKGGPNTWYSSSSERGAWAEFFRHHESPEVSPFEVRRRVGRAAVDGLAVLDLTQPKTRDALGVTGEELQDDDLRLCQQLADEAREVGFEGILAPSAALDGEQTLAVFVGALDKVREEHSRVQRPPVRMRDVLARIRLPDRAGDALRRLYRRLRRRP